MIALIALIALIANRSGVFRAPLIGRLLLASNFGGGAALRDLRRAGRYAKDWEDPERQQFSYQFQSQLAKYLSTPIDRFRIASISEMFLTLS